MLGGSHEWEPECYRNRWIVSYVGGVGSHRGLDTALRGVALAAEAVPELLLLIVGVNERSRVVLEREIALLGVSHLVELVDWQPFEKVREFIKYSDVALVPHNKSEHTQTTIPHKLFQYMISERPVLVSSCRPLKRVVDDSGCGLVFDADNPQDFAQKLIVLNQDREAAEQMGRNGREAALGPYSWRHDAQRLRDAYARLAPNKIIH